MEIEIEDLHIQMEDVVKSKLSVSFDVLLPLAQNLHSPVSTTAYSCILISCVYVFPYSQKQLGLNAETCFYLKGNYFHAVSTKTAKMIN